MCLDGETNDCIYTRAKPPNIRIHHYYIFKPNIITCIAGKKSYTFDIIK